MSGNPLAYLTAADFTAEVTALLPPGRAWQGPDLATLMAGVGDAFGDLHARAAQLSEIEMIPATTQELLPDWEYDFGLPDCCTPLAGSTEQRLAALAAKILTLGGQSPGYFVGVAAAMGYAITITRFAPPRCGALCGSYAYGDVWRFAWQVNCAANTITPARVNQSVCGDRLAAFSTATDLICRLTDLQPAQGTVLFAFS